MKHNPLLAGILAAGALVLPATAKTVDGLDGGISIKSQEAVVDVPIENVEYQVKWLEKPIRIDGDKADWLASGAKPFRLAGAKHATWSKGEYGGEKDFAADVWLGRDYDNFYIGVDITDDRIPAPDRLEVFFTDANTKLIVGWQDVGRRYTADDAHAIFVVKPDGSAGIHWAHIQDRIDRSVVQDSYGSESERRALLEQKGAVNAADYKIFSKTSSKVEKDGSSRTFVEIAFPWKTLLPFDPVNGHPVKMNIGIHDRDGEGLDQASGAIAWTPGLIGTTSGVHFPTLSFEPPKGRAGIDAFAQVPAFHYLKRDIEAAISFVNNGPEISGKLQLLAAPGKKGAPLAEADLKLPAGATTATIKVNSEDVKQAKLELMCRFIPENGQPVDFPVFAPRSDNTITIQHIAEIEARIKKLEDNFKKLSALYEKVEAAGLDTSYPKAYVTLLKMFIPRCTSDLGRGDSDRVIRNTEYLQLLYKDATDYMTTALRDPKKQLKLPPRFVPGELKIKDGFYYDGDRPVFLWGPCVFWYWRPDQPLVVDLGFNSVCPEVPQKADNEEVRAHMDYWYKHGVHVNASIHAPDLQLTGADASKSKLLQEHPELKNLDQNNFLSFVIQHPAARAKIKEGYTDSIGFWNNFPWIGSYWLWNEPWYLNYSEMTRKDFIEQYLKPKYKTVDALNKRWKSAYKNFDDVQLIKWPDAKNYAPWYDFQQFRDDLLVDFFGFLNKTSKELNPDKPTHTKFMAPSLHSFSIERLQGLYDIAGHDGNAGFRDIPFLDFCRSVYPEKPLSDTEVHFWYGGKTIVESAIWRLALHGLADGNWWCWHSNERFSDSLSNAQSMHALSFAGLDVQRLFHPHIHSLVTKQGAIATLFPDVVERRSDVKMVRIRFELAESQYLLGLLPFYATETRVAAGELAKHKYLLAGESLFVKDATYQNVLKFTKDGGTVIITKGAFRNNEYGDPRDASELVKAEGGQPFTSGSRVYPVGNGRVICIDELELFDDPVLDGGTCMRGGGTMENNARRNVYFTVLEKLMKENNIDQDIRLTASDPSTLNGYDWRAVKIGDAYTLAALPGSNLDVKLETVRPVKKITDLITGKEVPVKKFQLKPGPNLFSIELKR